jgi:hypothetical protein
MAATERCIHIQGHIGPEWSEWFNGPLVEWQPAGSTTLYGTVHDRALLRGMLQKIWDLGLIVNSMGPAAHCRAGQDMV